MIKFNPSKKLWGAIILIVLVALVLPGIGWAATDTTAFITEMLGKVLWFIWIRPFLILLQLEMWLLPIIAAYNNFTRVPGVVTGWGILRDLSNMFFILILLVIAIATIINVERFGYRALLRKLIIMAILINFSMTIVGLMIDLSQIVMLSFVSAIKDVAAGNIVVAFGLADAFNLHVDNVGLNQDTGNYLVTLILGALMIAVVAVVIGIFIIILAMRIVRLWILVVMAPLAFLFYVFPGTQKYYNDWMNELTNNLIIGPILAFFLWLSFTIIGRGDVYSKFIPDDPNPNEGITADLSAFTKKSNITNFIIALSMLLAGLQYAGKSGGAGANFASDGLKSIKGGLQRRATRMGMTVARPAMRVGGRLTQKFGGFTSKIPLGGRLLGGRGMQRTGLSMQARAQGFSAALQEPEAKKTKDMTEEQRKQFYTVGSQKFFGKMGGDSGALAERAKVDMGYYKDASKDAVNADGTPDIARRRKWNEMQEAHGRFKNYGTGSDDKYIASLETLNPELIGGNETQIKQRLESLVRQKGAAAVFGDMHLAAEGKEIKDAEGRVIGREVGKATAVALKLFLQQDARKRKAIYDGKDKPDQVAMAKALGSLEVDASKMFDDKRQIKKDSLEFSHYQTLGMMDPKAMSKIYKHIGHDMPPEVQAQMKANFLKEAKSSIEGKEMYKMDLGDQEQNELFTDLAKVMSSGQRTEFLTASSGSKDPKVAAMVNAQVQAGDIKVNIDNPITEDLVNDDELAKYFQQAVTDRDPTKMTEKDVRNKLARKNIDKAHIVFRSQPEELIEFAKTLKKEELLKIDTATLKSQIIPFLDESMQKVLAKDQGMGEAPPKKKKNKNKSGGDRGQSYAGPANAGQSGGRSRRSPIPEDDIIDAEFEEITPKEDIPPENKA
ncbi:MAG: hypothetical protein C3F02_02700 [Parcubacteria group bacterium]|nr:MAG: hypothetical protein C3F02_02700 [Parcubacteria group bacterium]